MKERPIIFDAESVRAILAGRKTQTRRVMKMGPVEEPFGGPGMYTPTVIRNGFEEPGDEVFGIYGLDGDWGERCPYGQPGDLLWVLEAWGASVHKPSEGDRIYYRADNDRPTWAGDRWRSPIHMPRWASRLTLRITDVRVERVQDIKRSITDMRAEGVELPPTELYPDTNTASKLAVRFERLWNSINAKRAPWASNPWVWVVEFERVEAAHA